MSSHVKAAKSERRSDLLQQIRNMPVAERKQRASRIENQLKLLLSTRAGYWGAYEALSDEPQINWQDVSNQIQWCFPQTLENELRFKFGARSHQRSALGVLEPLDGVDVSIDQLQGVIAPGVGFSEAGHRLGRGKGFYDRALGSFAGDKVGVCFGLSLKPELPHEAHDILFHQIVTEESVYQVDCPEGEL